MGKNLVRKTIEFSSSVSIPAGVKAVNISVLQRPVAIGGRGGGGLMLVLNKDMYGWGENSAGTIGDSSTTNRSSPVLISGSHKPRTLINVASGGGPVGGFINDEGQAYLWGGNAAGQLGDSSTSNASTPRLVTGGIRWKSITNGEDFCIGLDTKGIAWGWGTNLNGQLGINAAGIQKSTPTIVSGSPRAFKKIACGTNHAIGITSDGSVYGWGLCNYGELGVAGGSYSSPFIISPVAGLAIKDIALGTYTSYFLTETGEVYAMGDNTSGKLGINSATATTTSPILVAGGKTWREISAAHEWAMGIDSNGDAYSWGVELDGRLGQNTGTDKSSPVAVVGGYKFAQAKATFFNGLALRTDGVLMSWGRNSSGEIGDNTTTDRSSPVLVSGGRIPFTQQEVLISKHTISVSPGSSYLVSIEGTLAMFGATPLGIITANCYLQLEYEA